MRQYHRVFSISLDRERHWYAYDSTIDGYPKSNRRHKGTGMFKSLSDEIRQVRLDDVYGSSGNPAPYNWFNIVGQEEAVMLWRLLRLAFW